MLRVINFTLLLLLILLGGKALFANGGFLEVRQLQASIKQQQDKMEILRKNNDDLFHEINYFKTEVTAIEEQARNELGMIKQGESYYQIVEPIE